MDQFQLEILGFVAGAVNLASSVPQLIANRANPDLARNQSPARNCLQCAGNALWFEYGWMVGSAAMMTFSALGAAMALILAAQTVIHWTVGSKNMRQQLAL